MCCGGYVKINFHTKGIIVTAKQKSQMERKLQKLSRYVKDVEPVVCDITLADESGPEKNGIDQCVRINFLIPKERIHVEEVDDRIVRAFGFAYSALERRLRRYSKKRTNLERRDRSRLKNIIGSVGGAAMKVGGTVGRIVPRRRKKDRQ